MGIFVKDRLSAWLPKKCGKEKRGGNQCETDGTRSLEQTYRDRRTQMHTNWYGIEHRARLGVHTMYISKFLIEWNRSQWGDSNFGLYSTDEKTSQKKKWAHHSTNIYPIILVGTIEHATPPAYVFRQTTMVSDSQETCEQWAPSLGLGNK